MRVCVWAAVQGRGGVGGSVLVDIMLSQLSPLRVWSNNYAVTLHTKKYVCVCRTNVSAGGVSALSFLPFIFLV